MYVAALNQMYKKDAVSGWVNLVNGNPTLAKDWRSLSTNPDGTVVMGAAYTSGLWRSTDGGLTWGNVLNATMSSKMWTGVAMSADTINIVGSVEGPGIFRSTDFGTCACHHWSQKQKCCWLRTCTHTHIEWYAFTGATWREVTAGTSLASTYFSAIACSADGRKIYTCTYNGYVYASFDYGQTWSNILNVYRGYAGIGCNPEGTVVLTAVYGGGFVYKLTY